jgi:hypothetical protein
MTPHEQDLTEHFKNKRVKPSAASLRDTDIKWQSCGGQHKATLKKEHDRHVARRGVVVEIVPGVPAQGRVATMLVQWDDGGETQVFAYMITLETPE